MKYQRQAIILMVCIVIIGFQWKVDNFPVPKTWDLSEIKQFMLPTADSSVTVTPISEEYYYKLSEMKVYKSYPVRLLDSAANRKYIDSLKLLDPVDLFETPPKDEADLIRLGEEIFSAPFFFSRLFRGAIRKIE